MDRPEFKKRIEDRITNEYKQKIISELVKDSPSPLEALTKHDNPEPKRINIDDHTPTIDSRNLEMLSRPEMYVRLPEEHQTNWGSLLAWCLIIIYGLMFWYMFLK